MHILITGGTGLVGSHLMDLLQQQGHTVSNLSTAKAAQPNTYYWNPLKGEIDERAVKNVDVIVHLAGANIISHKWTKDRKKVILDSRVEGANLLLKACKAQNQKPKHFITASGIGYYQANSHKNLNETAPSGDGFAALVCRAWEHSADNFARTATHISKLRFGIVQAQTGGFWKEMTRLAKFKILAPLGSGNQWISWIHISDLCAIILNLIDEKIAPGVYNAVASTPVSNKELTRQIAKAFGAPSWLPHVPEFVLKIMLGERAEELLNSLHVSNQKLIDQGFSFTYNTYSEVVAELS